MTNLRALALALLGLLFIPTLAPAQQTYVAPPVGLGCAYNSVLPTLSTGFAGWVQCDSAGRLLIDSAGTGTSTVQGPGTAGTPSGGVLSVQGVSGGTPLPTAGTATIVPLSTSAAAVSHASTSALATSLVAKASAGNLFAYNCTAITGGSPGYCIVYNGTAAPSTGALTGTLVLDQCYFPATAQGCALSRTPYGAQYSTGIVILVTSATTPYTYTTGVDTAAITADFQ